MKKLTYNELRSMVSLKLLPAPSVISKSTGKNMLNACSQDCFIVIEGVKFGFMDVVNSFVNRTELTDERKTDLATHRCNLEWAYYNLENR